MKTTTVCYLERDGKVLMLHRVKKEHDENKDKWIGVGGKCEPGESPEDCVRREVYEETGYTLTDWRFRGVVTFVSDQFESQHMYLFTAAGFTGAPHSCDEGDLAWVEKERIPALPIWEGDKIFHRLLDAGAPFFSLKLTYQGDTLTGAVLDGKTDLLPQK